MGIGSMTSRETTVPINPFTSGFIYDILMEGRLWTGKGEANGLN